MKSEMVMKLIEAGYNKAEIDAMFMDDTTNTKTESKATETTESKAAETTESKATETTESKATETKSTASDNVSNVALLAAINNLTKALQESNRNSVTSDGGTAQTTTESVTDIMSKMFK